MQIQIVRHYRSTNYSNVNVGYTGGGGVEWMFMPNWSAKAEYLYTTYARETYLGNVGAGGLNLSADAHTLKAGINYHFK